LGGDGLAKRGANMFGDLNSIFSCSRGDKAVGIADVRGRKDVGMTTREFWKVRTVFGA